MDRTISKEQIKKTRNQKLMRTSLIVIIVSVGLFGIITLFKKSVNEKDLMISKAEVGEIEVSYSASGKVIPAFEEIITSPISSRILEVYANGGDHVEAGTPLLKLDLQSTETEYKKQLDEEQKLRYKLEQLRVNNRSELNNQEMQIKVAAMKLERMEVELRNERYLDSIGAGTSDKVLQTELNYKLAKLEYEQMLSHFEDQKLVSKSSEQVEELEYSIFLKSMGEMKRKLQDARVCSPRKAVLTYINKQLGAQVSEGTQLAILSDLSHFKVEGSISDIYSDKVLPGAKVIMKLGKEELTGSITSVTPLSQNGVISFVAQLDDDKNPKLSSGLNADLYVMSSVKSDVMRIGRGSFYKGKGEYELYVFEDDKTAVKRKIQLGESNYEYIEVLGGLQAGERVIVSNTDDFNQNKISVKK